MYFSRERYCPNMIRDMVKYPPLLGSDRFTVLGNDFVLPILDLVDDPDACIYLDPPYPKTNNDQYLLGKDEITDIYLYCLSLIENPDYKATIILNVQHTDFLERDQGNFIRKVYDIKYNCRNGRIGKACILTNKN
jgi:hypothetical protein